MTWFGNLSTWALIMGGWVGLSIVSSLVFGLIARIGREGGEE